MFFCLPSGKHVQALVRRCRWHSGSARAGQIFVDLGTSPVKLTRELADKIRKKGADYADAPIARTREAAIAGTLSVMVGATPQLFAMVEPVIRCFASEVTNCGSTGAGQVDEDPEQHGAISERQCTVRSLRHREAMRRRSESAVRDTGQRDRPDSFGLRNHGMKAIIPGEFPERAFSTEYALKDLSYALALADDVGT